MNKVGRKPYGYYDDELAVIESLILKANSRPHGKKHTLKQIADKLNEGGHKTQTGLPWYPVAVGRIIRKGLKYYQNLHNTKKTGKVIKPKTQLDSGDYLTKEEVLSCRSVLSSMGHIRIVYEVLLGTGLRGSECCALNIGDINIIKGLVDVRFGKGAKRRSVHIGPRLKEILEKYMRFVNIEKLDGNEPLFVNRRNNRLTYSDLYHWIVKVRERSGVECLHPHALRHTFGTYLYNYKMDLDYVREQLGHSNINTTRIYAKTLSKSKLEQMEGYERSFDL